MSIDPNDIDGEDLLAAEFVLGLLDANARRDAERRLRDDAAFAAEVARWESHFAPWLQAVAPVEAPSATWPRIRSILWSHELPQRAAATSAPASRWQSVSLWRGLAIGGILATAASLALVTVLLRQAPPATPSVVVTRQQPAGAPMALMLREDDGSVAYTATLDSDGMLVVAPARPHSDPRAPELWLIPAGDKPHSLGMLPRDRAMAMRIPARLLSSARDGLFAISMEPPGSGPHESPTGPVVAKGSLVTL